jgi:hypothetical protein
MMVEVMRGTADRAPAVIGGGILGITLLGFGAAALSLSVSFAVEAIAAAAGMLLAYKLT